MIILLLLQLTYYNYVNNTFSIVMRHFVETKPEKKIVSKLHASRNQRTHRFEVKRCSSSIKKLCRSRLERGKDSGESDCRSSLLIWCWGSPLGQHRTDSCCSLFLLTADMGRSLLLTLQEILNYMIFEFHVNI